MSTLVGTKKDTGPWVGWSLQPSWGKQQQRAVKSSWLGWEPEQGKSKYWHVRKGWHCVSWNDKNCTVPWLVTATGLYRVNIKKYYYSHATDVNYIFVFGRKSDAVVIKGHESFSQILTGWRGLDSVNVDIFMAGKFNWTLFSFQSCLKLCTSSNKLKKNLYSC